MKSLAKRVIAVLIIAVLAVSLCACTGSRLNGNTASPADSSTAPDANPTPTLRPFDEDSVVRIILSVDATNAYNHPGLPAEVKAQLGSEGMLMTEAQLTMPLDSTLDSIFRVLEISGIPVVSEETDGGTFITSIKGVANGSCGESSHWVVVINDETIESSIEEIELKSGDNVRFVYLADANEPAPTPEAQTAHPDGGSRADNGAPTAVPSADPGSKTGN